MENDKDVIFLAKLQQLVDLFDDIDNMIKDNPIEQSRVDSELSDYLHLIERENLNDTQMLNVTKKLKERRIEREKLRVTNDLIQYYNGHKSNLLNPTNRKYFGENLSKALKTLRCDYKFRVLSKDDIDKLMSDKQKEVTLVISNVKIESTKIGEHKVRKTKAAKVSISKEELQECIDKGMKNYEIAEKYDCTPLTVSHLRKKYDMLKFKRTKR